MHEWLNWLGNGLLPIVILIVFWLLYMRWINKGGGLSWTGLQRRQIALLEQQLEVLRQTNELLKKLVERN